MEKNKKLAIIFLVCCVLGMVGFASSFLMFIKAPNVDSEDNNRPETSNPGIKSGLVFNSIDETIYLENAIPTLDKFGVEGKGFSFTIKNETNQDMKYQLSLVDDNSTINNTSIRYELTKNNEVVGIYSLKEDGVLEKNIIKENEEISYTIKLWLDYNSDVKAGKLSKKIAVSEIVDEDIEKVVNEVNEPILTDGMIPVYYDSSTNSWYKGNNKNDFNNKWYDYDDALWANAVTVNSEKREYYMNSALGTKILPEDINSMWVWIPRFNVSIDKENIIINFVNTNSKAYSAFSFNNKELTGFWFSKFESGMKEDSECNTASLTKICNDSNNELYFVPNYPFTTKITMANLFKAIRKMELKNNIYGFKGTGSKLNNDGTIKNDTNDFDIHMIKNSEWQAVALLSSSKYGKTGNNNYDQDHKLIINNNSVYTGKAYYENELYDYNVILKGEAASSTGNITGVYDMAGGKREYVMVNNDEINIFNKKSNSGFSTRVKDYYYDNGFSYNDTTDLLKEKYSKENLLNKEPITRGGYKNTGNIFNIYGATDYIDKVSVETNSRACLVILKENSNEEKKES